MQDSDEPGRAGVPRPAAETRRALRATIEHALGEGRGSAPETEPPVISDHTLLQRIGVGAYGDVWLARNALGTLRAVKIVYRSCFDEERPYRRELHGILKYEPVSRSHPGLMQVLHVGRNDVAGFFYYVMELADDASTNSPALDAAAESRSGGQEPRAPPYRPRTLRVELAKGLRWAPQEAARVVLKVADALAHLHRHGLVHRDIKPSNVIFAAAEPKLADIGLVTSVGDARSFVGTEGFIPPEGPGTVQADIYSLGKVLYELATGRDRLEFPQLPLDVRETPEGHALLDLNEVITRACAPEPKERYATVDRFRADLQTFLAGRSLRDAHKVARHLAWLKALTIATFVLLAAGGAAVWIAQTRETRALERARTEAALRARTQAAERGYRQELYTALVEQARANSISHEVGQRVRCLEALRRAAAITNSSELRQIALAALALPDVKIDREIPYDGDCTCAELDPTFERVALCKGNGLVEIHSARDQLLLARLPPSTNQPGSLAAWSSDGRFLGVKRNRTVSGNQSDVEVWDTRNMHRALLVREAAFGVFCFHPHLARFLGTCGEGSVAVWDLESGTQLARFSLEGDPNWLAISPDGERFAAACQAKTNWVVSVYRMKDGARLTSCSSSDVVGSLDWHPGGVWVAIADHSGAVYLLNSWTGERHLLGRHKAQAVLARFSPDGGYLLSGGWEREMIFWDLGRRERVFTLRQGSFSARFRADGRECALASEARFQILSFELPACVREFAEDLGGRVHLAAFSPDGQWLAASGLERLGLWDLTQPGTGVLAEEGADSRLYFAADDQLVASGEHKAFRWRPHRASEGGATPILEPLPLAIPDGFSAVCVNSNSIAWTTSGGSRITELERAGPDDQNWAPTVRGVNGLSADRQWLAVFQPYSRLLQVYRLPRLELTVTLTNGENISGFAFSSSSDQLAISSSTRVQFWNTRNWRHLREISHFSDVLFSPRERAMWLTRGYSEAGLYDSRALELLVPLPTGWLPLALSPNGRHLAVSVDLQRVQLWDLERLREEFRALGLDWLSAGTR